jgi:hypothetical protein
VDCGSAKLQIATTRPRTSSRPKRTRPRRSLGSRRSTSGRSSRERASSKSRPRSRRSSTSRRRTSSSREAGASKVPENWPVIRDLQEALGAALGASRAVVDAGWIDHQHQVGQTGKVVSPTLYVACGISGADPASRPGMGTSKVIVAMQQGRGRPDLQGRDVRDRGRPFRDRARRWRRPCARPRRSSSPPPGEAPPPSSRRLLIYTPAVPKLPTDRVLSVCPARLVFGPPRRSSRSWRSSTLRAAAYGSCSPEPRSRGSTGSGLES